MMALRILYTLAGGPPKLCGPRLQPIKPIGKSGTGYTLFTNINLKYCQVSENGTYGRRLDKKANKILMVS